MTGVRSIATLVDEPEKKNPNAVQLLPIFAKHPMVREVTAELADEDFQVSRVLVRLREMAPTLDRNEILDGLDRHLATQPELEGLDVRPTGVFLLHANMLNSLLELQRSTCLYVALAVLLMLVSQVAALTVLPSIFLVTGLPRPTKPV